MTDPEHDEITLVFDSDSREFARGFDAGLLVASVNDLEEGESICQPVFPDNAEMVMRIASYADCSFTADADFTNHNGIDWLIVTFTKN